MRLTEPLGSAEPRLKNTELDYRLTCNNKIIRVIGSSIYLDYRFGAALSVYKLTNEAIIE